MQGHAINRDLDQLRKLGDLITDPRKTEELSSGEILSYLEHCQNRLSRVRMGGRSDSLAGLCLLLWHGVNRQEVRTRVAPNVEAIAGLAIRTVADPSFIKPERGIVLLGVLICRWMLPGHTSDSETVRQDILEQVRLVTAYYASDHSGLPERVRVAAQTLLAQWNSGFTEEFAPVVRKALAEWPTTEELRHYSEEDLAQRIEQLSKRLPATLSRDELALYRLYLERQGQWTIYESLADRFI